MKRDKHSLSHYRLLTCNMGDLVPCGLIEVLPGDSIQQATSLLLRCSPLVAPVMHPVTVRVHHWFVPHRISWDGWESFITGGADGEGDGEVPPFTGVQNWPKGSLADYLGIPTGRSVNTSTLPFEAYRRIYNEFYRDQDLAPEVPLGSGIQKISWEKDYFTSARPWPQKGPDVSLPLGLQAPVVPTGDGIPRFDFPGYPLTDSPIATVQGQQYIAGSGVGNAATTNAVLWNDPKLIADLTNATAVNVNEVRKAFALQRYQEARARYGSRYTEYLRYLGVRSSDARLQRPEYLGGGKQTISFSEVLQTGPGSTEGSPVPGGVGQMAGHGISAMRSRRYRRFFEEHGFVLSLLSVRPRVMYTEALHRHWTRVTKEDYWQRELEQIGQQEVYSREVYGYDDANGGANVFGYQDRYSEYKHHPSTVHGDFRDTLDFWHMGRKFAAPPVLNQSFVECDPTKRIFQEQTQDSLWVMVNHSIQARRMVRRSPASRIL